MWLWAQHRVVPGDGQGKKEVKWETDPASSGVVGGLILPPSSRYHETRMWSYLESQALQIQWVKMKSYWIRVGSKSNDCCPYRKWRGHWRREEGHVKTGQRWERYSSKARTPRIAGSHERPGRGKEGSPARAFGGSTACWYLDLDYWPPEPREAAVLWL